MHNIFVFIELVLYRIRNKCIILFSQRPEVFFAITLFGFAAVSITIFVPSLLDYSLEIKLDMFPELSHMFLSAVILPFIVFILNRRKNNNEELSIINYIFRNYFRYFKALGTYIISTVLSTILLYTVLSIYDNISILSSLFLWHISGLLLFLCSYILALFVNNIMIVRRISFPEWFPSFNSMFILFILLLMSLPIHRGLGVIWLINTPNVYVLFPILVLLILLYIYVVSKEIKSIPMSIGNGYDFQRLGRRGKNIYLFLLSVSIGKNIFFYLLSICFLTVLGLLTKQHFVMLDLFMVLIMIGNIGVMYREVSRISMPLKMLRASNFKYSFWLLHTYFIISFSSIVLFHLVISVISNTNLLTVIVSSDLLKFGFCLYIGLYLSIIVAYLLGEYLGPLSQSISSGIILVVGYIITPELLSRLLSLGNIILELLVIITILVFLFYIKWVIIHEYKNSEVV